MKNKEKLIDTLKSIIIIYLLFSAVFLFFKAVIYESDNFFGFISFFKSNSANSQSIAFRTNVSPLSSQPIFILITNEDGSHSAVKYNGQVKEKMFSQFSVSLGEALGSSGEPIEISVSEWQMVLKKSGVFFDYLYPQPLSAIALSLGTNMNSGASSDFARRLYLGNDSGNLKLYFISEINGLIYSCDTAVSFSTISDKIAEYPMGNANFAFEIGEKYSSLDPYFIFSGESTELRSVSSFNPLQSNFDKTSLLEIFGINVRAASKYKEAGSVVYVDGEKSLRIDEAGKVLFSVTGNSGIAIPHSSDKLTIIDCIYKCSEILRTSLSPLSGDGDIYLVNIENINHPSLSSISFGYHVGGIPVTLPTGYAASFDISGGTIIRAELYFRHYSFSGDTILALPEKQAITISKSKEPILTYEEKNDGIICTWINN